MRYLFILLLFTLHTASAQDSTKQLPVPVSMDSLFRAKERESIGKTFPAFKALFGKDLVTKESLQGKVVFINFWFEACPPCIAELDALNKLFNKFSGNKNFLFISFTHEKPAKIYLLKKKYKLRYRIASVSNQECYRLNQNNGFPTSIILDRNGIIKHLFTGGTTNRGEAGRFILNTVYKKLEEELGTDHAKSFK